MKRFSQASRRCAGACLLALLSLGCSSDPKKNDDACTPDDADGVIDEPAPVFLRVTDSKFAPLVVATQNSSEITLTLQNDGTTPHSFVVDCLPTPNSDGCPMESCFPSDSQTGPVEPGQKVEIVFETPLVEGIYNFHSDLPEDTELEPGQFIIQ